MPAKKEIFGGEKRATGDVQASRVLEMYVPAVGGLRATFDESRISSMSSTREASVGATVTCKASRWTEESIGQLRRKQMTVAFIIGSID